MVKKRRSAKKQFSSTSGMTCRCKRNTKSLKSGGKVMTGCVCKTGNKIMRVKTVTVKYPRRA